MITFDWTEILDRSKQSILKSTKVAKIHALLHPNILARS